MSIIRKLYKAGHLNVGQSFATDTHMEVLSGSHAYGTAADKSDVDVHGFCTPPIDMVFPWKGREYIPDFDDIPPKFEHFQQHHINAFDKEYDVAIYSIVKLFRLAADNNPNVLDILWVPNNCIIHCDAIGHHVRKNRKHFLHKGAYHRFRGYSHAQFKKLNNSHRTELIETYGYDVKNAFHIVRLALYCEQILIHGDMDFSVHAAFLKEVRNGCFKTVEELREWYHAKEKDLDALYLSSSLPYTADKDFLRQILLSCLETKYGSLSEVAVGAETNSFRKLEEIRQILERN